MYALIFRRNSSPELGWDWYRGIGAPNGESRETFRLSIDAYIRKKAANALVPHSPSRYRFIICDGDLCTIEADIEEMRWLNKNNQRYMVERAKWPSLASDCSDKALASLIAELAQAPALVREPHSQTGNERGKSRTKKKTVDPVEGGER